LVEPGLGLGQLGVIWLQGPRLLQGQAGFLAVVGQADQAEPDRGIGGLQVGGALNGVAGGALMAGPGLGKGLLN
jgi:hypothetical protein